MKKKINHVSIPSVLDRQYTYQTYLNKYFNLYLNAYKFEGLDYQQKNFLLRKFWANGKIAGFKLKGSENNPMKPEGLLVLTDFAATGFNIYDYPVEVTLINTRGVKFIPSTPQVVDTDVVIGYAQWNKKPVMAVVQYYLEKIVDIEMIIKTNSQAQKTPQIYVATPESRTRMEEFAQDVQNDEPQLFLEVDDIKNIQALSTGAPYVLDKLYSYKCALENELREYLGLRNLGVGEKKEHLISNEIDANNEATESSGECFLDSMKDFFDRVKEVLGITVSVEANVPDQAEKEEKMCEQEDKDNEEI